MIKRLILAALLLVPCSAEAKSLTNGSNLAPATDTGYAAVVNINAEITKIYGYLNELYRMQSGTSVPALRGTYDLWLDTNTTPPLIKYYTGSGSTFNVVGNGTTYTGGLTHDASAVGRRDNCVVNRESAAKVTISATATNPCTVEDAGNLLQVTADTSYTFSSKAAGHYYLKPVRVGTTTAFTLSVDTSNSAGTNYFADITLSAEDVIGSILNYDEFNEQAANLPLGLFFVQRVAAESRIATPSLVNYDTVQSNAEAYFDTGTKRYTPTRRGWYEFHATQTLSSPQVSCVYLRQNDATIAANCDSYGSGTHVTTTVFMDGDDYIDVYSSSASTLDTVTNDWTSNAFWGRWVGGAF